MSSSSDDLDRLRFRFYVDNGYYPSDNTLNKLLVKNKSREEYKFNKNIREIIPNEEDEYNLFLSELLKLEHNKKETSVKDKKKSIHKSVIKKASLVNNNTNDTIENYQEQRNLFLETIQKQNYRTYSTKNNKTSNNFNIFRKPDILKALPRQTIDLHGMTRDRAYLYIKESVEEAVLLRESPILVIHGKGLHNEYGRSLVKESLDEYILKDDKTLIVYYHKAPKHLGGSGATLLYLKY